MQNIDSNNELVTEIRVHGEMAVEVILALPNQADREALLEKAKQMVIDALKVAINDIPECSAEAQCSPYQDLEADFIDDKSTPPDEIS